MSTNEKWDKLTKFHFLQSPYGIHDIDAKPWFRKQKYTGCLSLSKTTDRESGAQPNLTSAHGNNGVVLKTAKKFGDDEARCW